MLPESIVIDAIKWRSLFGFARIARKTGVGKSRGEERRGQSDSYSLVLREYNHND